MVRNLNYDDTGSAPNPRRGDGSDSGLGGEDSGLMTGDVLPGYGRLVAGCATLHPFRTRWQVGGGAIQIGHMIGSSTYRLGEPMLLSFNLAQHPQWLRGKAIHGYAGLTGIFGLARVGLAILSAEGLIGLF